LKKTKKERAIENKKGAHTKFLKTKKQKKKQRDVKSRQTSFNTIDLFLTLRNRTANLYWK
jgi:prephenate dehydratase